MDTCRQTDVSTYRTLSLTLDHWMTWLKTRDRTTENRQRETADSGGKTMGSHEPSLDRRWLPERCGRNSSTLFSYRQTELENPTLATSSPVHLGTLNPVFFPVPTIVILPVIWFEFDSVLSIKSGPCDAVPCFDTCHYFSPSVKLG